MNEYVFELNYNKLIKLIENHINEHEHNWKIKHSLTGFKIHTLYGNYAFLKEQIAERMVTDNISLKTATEEIIEHASAFYEYH